MFDFSWFSDPNAWAALFTLTLLEIVLGIDNIVFISILVAKLPVERQAAARRIGLLLAMGMRIALLLAISWVMGLTQPLFSVLGNWNSFVWPLIVVQDSRLATVPVAMSQLESVMNSSMANGALMAGAMLASLPTMALFLSFQRQFVESIAMTGIRA